MVGTIKGYKKGDPIVNTVEYMVTKAKTCYDNVKWEEKTVEKNACLNTKVVSLFILLNLM